MTQYMLMFSLGPVQSFIAQARKTRDLWLGSYLLSTLMVGAMSELEEFAPGKRIEEILIFPAKREIENFIPDLPNKYVAIFDDADRAWKAAEKSKANIVKRWQTICDQVWAAVIKPYASEETESIWKRQTNAEIFFEIFWVVVQQGKGPEPYQQWLKHTQESLDARKRLRNFFIPANPDNPDELINEPNEKSTISGEHEALRSRQISRAEVRNFWKRVATRQSAYDLNKEGRERLDSIDTVKRFATESSYIPKQPFPSTSSVATASFVERLLEADTNLHELKEWISVTETEIDKKKPLAAMPTRAIPYLENLVKKDEARRSILKRDGDCYFPETFTEYRLHEDYGVSPEIARTIAKQGSEALSNLLRSTREKNIMRPRSYYAMIQMDGDKMGVLLSGVNGQTEHKDISKALSDFARENVPGIVETNYPGRLIYAGGDDVFALAPLARDYSRNALKEGEALTVLNLVDRLQQQYRTLVSKAVIGEERQENVTASIGIAIAHHFTSLSYVRRMAKEAEDRAKKFYGRNALVVTLLRRSGEQTQVGCRWRYDEIKDEKGQPIKLFSQFYDLFKQDALSFKCIYILLEEASALVNLEIAAQRSEIRRVLLRQRNPAEEIKKLLPDDEVKDLAGYIAQLGAAIDGKSRIANSNEELSTDLHSDKRRYGLVEALGWLLVIAFLAREEQE